MISLSSFSLLLYFFHQFLLWFNFFVMLLPLLFETHQFTTILLKQVIKSCLIDQMSLCFSKLAICLKISLKHPTFNLCLHKLETIFSNFIRLFNRQRVQTVIIGSKQIFNFLFWIYFYFSTDWDGFEIWRKTISISTAFHKFWIVLNFNCKSF